MELQQKRRSIAFQIILIWALASAASFTECSRRSNNGHIPRSDSAAITPFKYVAPTSCRAHTASLSDFGGVGDGTTSNTAAFMAAVSQLAQFASDGGGLLFVPPGRWLTGPFNLTSYFTLFLHQDAVLLASQAKEFSFQYGPSHFVT